MKTAATGSHLGLFAFVTRPWVAVALGGPVTELVGAWYGGQEHVAFAGPDASGSCER